MVDLEKLAKASGTFFVALTWKRIAMAAVLLALAGVAILFWINREYISGAIRPAKMNPQRQEIIIDDGSRKAIDTALKKSAGFANTIFVVSYSLERNTRRIIYWQSLDAEITRQQEEFVRTHATVDVAAFNNDPVNNRRMIAYINGEFVCTDFSQTAASKYLVDVNVKYVCATAIPPVYGMFRGTVVMFLKIIPDDEEKVRLKIFLRDLANQIDNPDK